MNIIKDNIMNKLTAKLPMVIGSCLLSLVITGCTFEQEDYFDETASLRITHINQKIKNQLVQQSSDANHGWVIQYFVAGTDDYDFEGFNIFGRFFEDGKVTLASNHRYLRNGNANKYTEATSTFKMLAEEGPVLSFDTWNDILTVFEDPVDPSAAPGSIVNNGEGMNGDHNLVLASLEDDQILFHGERHRASIRFIPCDRPWEEYIQVVNDMKDKISNSTLTSYYVTNSTDTMYFSRLSRGYFNYVDRLEDPLKNKVLSCVFTPEGFRLHHVDSLGTNAFQEFKLAEDESKLLSEDGQTQVIACWDNYIVSKTAVWKIDPSTFTAQQASLYDQIAAELLKYNKNYVLESIGLGRSSGGNAVKGVVLTFYTNAAQTKTNTAGLSTSLSRLSYGNMELKYTSSDVVDANMTAISKRATNLEQLTREFAATLNGIYEVTPNDFFLPTGAEFKSTTDGHILRMGQ